MTSINWDDLVVKVTTFVNDGAPVVEELVPAWAPAIQIGTKLLTAAANAEPVAVGIVKQIQSGQAPTPDQLQQFSTQYEAAYQALHADLAAQIAAAPTS